MSYSSEVLADNPLGYWRLASGSLTTDSSPNTKTLTQNGTAFTAVSSLISSDSNGATQFDNGAATGTLTTSDASFRFNATGSFSVELWFKVTTNPDTTYRRILAMTDDGSGTHNGYAIQYQSAAGMGGVRYSAGVAAGVAGWYLPGTFTTAETWHVVMTYDGANVKTYVNGTYRGQEADTASQGTYSGSVSIGGGQFGGSSCKAVIDEVAIYGTALNSTRITAHYNAAQAQTPPFMNVTISG